MPNQCTKQRLDRRAKMATPNSTAGISKTMRSAKVAMKGLERRRKLSDSSKSIYVNLKRYIDELQASCDNPGFRVHGVFLRDALSIKNRAEACLKAARARIGSAVAEPPMGNKKSEGNLPQRAVVPVDRTMNGIIDLTADSPESASHERAKSYSTRLANSACQSRSVSPRGCIYSPPAEAYDPLHSAVNGLRPERKDLDEGDSEQIYDPLHVPSTSHKRERVHEDEEHNKRENSHRPGNLNTIPDVNARHQTQLWEYALWDDLHIAMARKDLLLWCDPSLWFDEDLLP